MPPSASLPGPLLLIGCGKMGGALLSGWLSGGVAAGDVWIVEPNPATATFFRDIGVNSVGDAGALPADLKPRVTLLAVKPQFMDDAVAPLVGSPRDLGLLLSIAAGKTIGYYQRLFGTGRAIVRAMPNTPASVGRGMTVMVATPEVSADDRELCSRLMSAVGDTAWVEDEGLIDPVTAVSGGGPAYVFLLVEALAEAGRAAGLPADLALRIARSTVAGSGELLRQSQEPAAQLRENVTSPGGTTLEALKVLMAEDGLQPLMTRAIAAATRRSRELDT